MQKNPYLDQDIKDTHNAEAQPKSQTASDLHKQWVWSIGQHYSFNLKQTVINHAITWQFVFL